MHGEPPSEAIEDPDAMGDPAAMPHSESAGMAHEAGITAARIVRFDVVGTSIFVVSATLSAVVFTGPLRVIAVVVAVGLFATGVVAFLWSYWTAVQRSRTENIAVAQLYFLAGGSTPHDVKWTMNAALVVQISVALVTAISRSSTDGRAGSTLAFGILVPMFGLGLNGLWCSKFGRFSPRQLHSGHANATDAASAVSVPPFRDEMEQNSTHG